MASIYKRGKTYQVKFSIGGKTYQKSLKTGLKSRAEYLKKEFEKYEEVNSYPPVEQVLYGNNSVHNDIEDFLKVIEEQNNKNLSIAEATRRRNIDYINNLKYFLKEYKIKYFYQIKPSTAFDYRNWRLNTPAQRKGKNISAVTVKKELSFLKNSIFELAVDENIIEKNPFKNATKGLKVYPKEKNPFTKKEVERLINNAPNRLHRDFYITAYFTGARFGEVANLEWNEIDFNEEILLISDKGTHRTKVRKSRILPIHPTLLKLLHQRKKLSKGKYVFPSKNDPDKPLSSIRTLFNIMKRDLKIDLNKKLHSFRVSFGSDLQEEFAPVEASMELLGHTDIRMTAHYQKASIELKRKAVFRLNLDIKID
jgi:integrase